MDWQKYFFKTGTQLREIVSSSGGFSKILEFCD